MPNSHSLDLESSSSQYASITDGSQTGLDVSADISIEAWIKLESEPGANGRYGIVSKYDDNNKRSWIVYISEQAGTGVQRLQAIFSDDGTYTDGHRFDYRDANIDFQAGQWYHIAVTFDISVPQCYMYINGTQYSPTILQGTTIGANLYNTDAPFIIGARYNNAVLDRFFDGLIDEVRVWSDVRTAQEISDNYLKELTGSEANLVGYWKFNNDYLDETSNNNDLTATNSPVFSTDVPFVGFTPVMFWY